MAPLHPELAQLKDRFESLLDDYEAGHIDFDTAESTLKSLVVIDGTGAHWSLDQDGNFMRGMPGGQTEAADPVSFRPAQLPMRPGATPMPVGAPIPAQAAPWAAQHAGVPDLHTPPSGFLAQSPGAFNPLDAPGAGPHVPGFPQMPTDTVVPPRIKKGAGSKPVKVSLPKRPGGAGGAAKSSGPSFVTGLVDKVASIQPSSFLQGRGKTILIAVVCAAVLGIGWMQFGGSEEPTSAGIPTTGTAADMPVDPAAPAPNGDQINQIISAVTSGDAAVAAGAVQQPADTLAAIESAGILANTQALGLAVVPGPANGTVQDWNLMRGEEKIATAKVTFVLEGEAWKLASWPTFAK